MVNALLRSQLWGSIFQDPEIAAEFSGDAFLARMLQFERAWTLGLKAAGTIDQAQAHAALQAIDGFQSDNAALETGADRDGLPVPEFTRQLKAGLSEHAQKAIHSGSTSQDVLDTSIVLASLAVLERFQNRLTAIIGILHTLQDRFAGQPLMGRTRMQAALPITVGQRIQTWQAPLDRVAAALPALTAQTAVVQVGGAVGDRAFPGDTDEILQTVAAELGLAAPSVWHTDRTVMVDLGHWMMKTTGACAKLGKDISLMAQQGFGEVRLSGAGGSSAMPHKQNPIRAEVLIALARFVAGQNAVLGQAMIHEQERSGEAWALEWLTLPAMFEATGASLNAAQGLLGQIEHLGAPDSAAL